MHCPMPDAPRHGAEIERFLLATVAPHGGPAQRFETHGALVFVGPRETLKIKRPVHYSYMNFSTLEQRRRACKREVEINHPHAPDIYLGLAAVTRQADGSLALDGNGEPVEWAVRMRSFPQDAVLSNRIARGALDSDLVKSLAVMVARYHAGVPRVAGHDSAAQLALIIADLDRTFREHASAFPTGLRDEWRATATSRLEAARKMLAKRAAEGEVGRCHGDLHLGNIVLWEGVPVAFDAIEFDEQIATTDILYDLAFLLMDLDRHGHREHANLVLSRYLWLRQLPADLEALAALPLFLSLRAAVRAMVAVQRADLKPAEAGSRDHADARNHLELALSYLKPAAPILVAIGGVSGTGKSTLAAAIAPSLGPAPGAVHLRSDLERKSLMGARETERLDPDAYTSEVSRRVYASLEAKARLTLRAGHAVVLDAAHLEECEREAATRLASDLGVPFAGLWLEAPADMLVARVEQRKGDASDATRAVVEAQLARPASSVLWHVLDTAGDKSVTLGRARKLIADVQMHKFAMENHLPSQIHSKSRTRT